MKEKKEKIEILTVEISGEKRQIPWGTTVLEVAKQYQSNYPYDIVLAYLDGKLCELKKRIKRDCKIEFITVADDLGFRTYKRSAVFLLLKAIYDVVGKEKIEKVKVMYSISKGYYCVVGGDTEVNQEFISKVKERMTALVEQDVEIVKESINTEYAAQRFAENGMKDKETLFKYRRGSKTNIYRIEDYEDYFYGYMLPSTGYIKAFDLFLYQQGLVIQLPERSNPLEVPEFKEQNKLFYVMKRTDDWGKMLSIDTVGDLNDYICKHDINDLILVQEALQEKKIGDIAAQIAERKNQIVLIAGPSSSGKTTFSHRLSIQLKTFGINPHPIPVDDYFVDREQTPRDEFGELDFETLGAIDVAQFNEDMNGLLRGEEVQLPTFNFVTGKREYNKPKKRIGKNDVLVIEGIHGLNEKLTLDLPKDSLFKIYISALTQLNIDEHNRIATTDGRLVRRIIRDARTRGTSAQQTIAMWNSVRRGEERNIFPFQEEADVMFNSALIYELAVLKQFAEPLLFAIDKDCNEYQEAKRLLKFFDYFIGVNTESVPKNSILREFIGGSCFKV